MNDFKLRCMKRVFLFVVLIWGWPAIAFAQIDETNCSTEGECHGLLEFWLNELPKRFDGAIAIVDTRNCKSSSWETLAQINDKYKNAIRIAKQMSAYLFKFTTEKAIASQLGLADLALKVGCVDIADANYRDLLNSYGQSRAVSARAQLGIDDVRAKRSSIMCSWFGRC
jgi:hypothetical protein